MLAATGVPLAQNSNRCSMEDFQAVSGIQAILTESWTRHGIDCPLYVKNYIARILAEKMDKNPWQPEPSYAEKFMTLRTPTEALELGNTCFFTRSVFPTIGERRGISSNYYVSIGQGCYEQVLKHSDIPAVRTLYDHFEYCAEITWTAVYTQGGVREFWDL